MRRHRNLFQLKEQEKTPENTTNEIEINNLPDKEFKTLVIRMLTEWGERIDEHSENFNRKLEHMKKNQSEVKNTITKMKKKNILEGINSRLGDTEERISDLEDRMIETPQSEQWKEKQIKKWEQFKGPLGQHQM